MPEPHWRLPVAGIAAIIGVTIPLVLHVSGKTDKADHEVLKREVVTLDKEHALTAQKIENIEKGIQEIKDLMREVSRNQNTIMLRMSEPRDREFIGPSQPNPLSR